MRGDLGLAIRSTRHVPDQDTCSDLSDRAWRFVAKLILLLQSQPYAYDLVKTILGACFKGTVMNGRKGCYLTSADRAPLATQILKPHSYIPEALNPGTLRQFSHKIPCRFPTPIT